MSSGVKLKLEKSGFNGIWTDTSAGRACTGIAEVIIEVVHATQTVVKFKPEKKHSGLNEIRTHDLCDTDAVLYQLNYQANRGLVT